MPFSWAVECHVLRFCAFVGDFIVKRTPKPTAEVLSTIPKSKEAVTGFMEKMCVSKKLLSGLNYVLLAMDSTLRNRQQSLTEVSLDVKRG